MLVTRTLQMVDPIPGRFNLVYTRVQLPIVRWWNMSHQRSRGVLAIRILSDFPNLNHVQLLTVLVLRSVNKASDLTFPHLIVEYRIPNTTPVKPVREETRYCKYHSYLNYNALHQDLDFLINMAPFSPCNLTTNICNVVGFKFFSHRNLRVLKPQIDSTKPVNIVHQDPKFNSESSLKARLDFAMVTSRLYVSISNDWKKSSNHMSQFTTIPIY
ncbi:hypothetical protein ABKN59_006493 [Abortiporus biennis]